MSKSDPRTVWSAALESEVGFWDQWFATKGLQWPDDYRARLDPNTPLQEFIRGQLLEQADKNPIEILDVGAGPITSIGFRWEGHNVRITAVDPLADMYDRLFEKYAVTPPVRTTWCHGEALSNRFAPETFDLVHASNSLDHSYNPMVILGEALRVAKTGGAILLSHNRNEAENEGYNGLHQWNFCGRDGDFVIWSKTSTLNVSKLFAPFAAVECWDDGQGVGVKMKKLASPKEHVVVTDASLRLVRAELDQSRAELDLLNRSLAVRTARLMDRFPRVKATLMALGNRVVPE